MDLNTSNKVIIFSHGFGIQKDNLGLFTFLSEKLQELGYKTILFDYYNYEEATKEVFTVPFSQQALKLQEQIDKAKKDYPDKEIIIIAHSQGSIIPTLCNVKGITKIFAISPFFITDKDEVYKRYAARQESSTDFNGISRRKHSDGKVTVIPPEYWQERFNTNQYELYNGLALQTSLTLIYGHNDSLVKAVDLSRFHNCSLIETDADHDFTGINREELYKILVERL